MRPATQQHAVLLLLCLLFLQVLAIVNGTTKATGTSPVETVNDGLQAQAHRRRRLFQQAAGRPEKQHYHPKRSPQHPKLRGAHTNHLLVIPEHRLIFCYIAKNNCQSFNHLFTSLRSRYDESLLEGGIWGRNDMHSHNITLPQLADLVYDDTWHKAVFYREPLVRYLSAYRSKCEVGHDDGFELCTALFGKPNPTFAEAVERLTQDPPVDNPHFRPQVDFCGGLGAILPQFQTVEALDPRTSRNAVAALLRRVGVADPEGVPAFNERFPPFNAAAGAWRPNDSYARHTTDAAAAVEAYYTPYLACVVVTHFLDDYLTFGVAVPEWAWRLGLRDVGRDCAALR